MFVVQFERRYELFGSDMKDMKDEDVVECEEE